MRIIISPAKQMRADTDSFTCSTIPVFMEKTEVLMHWIQGLSYEAQKKLWACNDSRVIINLASKDYSRCIEKYLQPDDRYITCIFGEMKGEKIVQKGVYAKMARGEMVRYMAANAVMEPEQIKTFDWSGYCFRGELSTDKEYVFIRKEIPGKPGKHPEHAGAKQGAAKKNWFAEQ
ncbi:MAG: peroxide stress protein YaaA [Eubacteriales bacterium]|nr:peroxide stress protein YaaA [Eubacteriales bacterium]